MLVIAVIMMDIKRPGKETNIPTMALYERVIQKYVRKCEGKLFSSSTLQKLDIKKMSLTYQITSFTVQVRAYS